MSGWLGFAAAAGVLALAAGRACATADDGPAGRAPRAAGAEGYCRWLTGCLDAIAKDLPEYTRSAEAAAKLYVTDGCEIGACGGDPFVREVFNRAGGMMRMMNFDKPFGRGAPADAPGKAIALVGLRDDMTDAAAGKIAEFVKRECHVIVFGRAELIDKVRKTLPDGAQPNAWIDTHAAPHGGLVQDAGGQWIIPTDSVALSAASWVWVGEFVAACTRLGKMPPMYLAYAVEGAAQREAKFKGLKFHDKLPCTLEAGRPGRQFLAELQRSLAAVRDLELPRIREAAAEAARAKAAGGKLWVYPQGHVLLDLMGYPHDPRWFDPIHRGWNSTRQDVRMGAGDFVLCVGYDQIYEGPKWQDFAAVARKAGAKLAWSFAGYRSDQVKAVPAGEPFIDQHWAEGDAVADVPNYDIKCLPTSGVIAESVLWMVHAEMLAPPGGTEKK